MYPNRFLLPGKALAPLSFETRLLRLKRKTQTAMAAGLLDTMLPVAKPGPLATTTGSLYYAFYHKFHRGAWMSIPHAHGYSHLFVFTDNSALIANSQTPITQSSNYEEALKKTNPVTFYPAIFGLHKDTHLLVEPEKGRFGRLFPLKGLDLKALEDEVLRIAQDIPNTPHPVRFHQANQYPQNPIAPWAASKPDEEIRDSISKIFAGAILYHDMPLNLATLEGRILFDNGTYSTVQVTTRLLSLAHSGQDWSALLSEKVIPVLNKKVPIADQIAILPRMGTQNPPRRYSDFLARYFAGQWNSGHKVSEAISAYLT